MVSSVSIFKIFFISRLYFNGPFKITVVDIKDFLHNA